MRRYRKNPTDALTDKLLLYGAIGVGLYLLITNLPAILAKAGASAVNAAGQAAQSAGASIAEALSPGTQQSATAAKNPPGTVTVPGLVFYTVVFPDGSSHSVDASTVSASGAFTYNGQGYTLYQGVGGSAAVLNSSIVATQPSSDSSSDDSSTPGASWG